MSKHFNAGNVWGTIKSLKKEHNERKTPCLMIEVDCGGKYGSVRAFGRLFGEQKIDGLIDFHKENPGAVVRLRGYLGQYEKSGEVRTNYTFYAWEEAAKQDRRAAFVLVGAVTSVVDDGDLLRLSLHLERGGKDGHEAQKEDFDLWAFDARMVSMRPGQVVEVKGCMQQGEGEDEYGSCTGDVRPIIFKSRIVEGF